MDDQLAALVDGNVSGAADGFLLSLVPGGVAAVAFTNHRPAARSLHHVLIDSHDVYLCFLLPGAVRRRKRFLIVYGKITLAVRHPLSL
jgi:hypothetical protein